MTSANKMAAAPMGRLLCGMSAPPLLSMGLQYSYNLVDSAFVAQLGENALAAVSLSFPITTLMNAASIWIGVGVNVVIAGYLGRREPERADAAVTHGLILALLVGALLNALSLWIMDRISAPSPAMRTSARWAWPTWESAPSCRSRTWCISPSRK